MTAKVRSTIENVIKSVLRDKGQNVPELSDGAFLMRAPSDMADAIAIGLDSLDIAQTIVQLERDLGTDPFRAENPPQVRTLAELTSAYEDALAGSG